MKIFTLEQNRLNQVYPGFGDMIVNNLPFYKDHNHIMLHQSSVTELFSNPTIPHEQKQVLQVMLMNINGRGYGACQVIKN